MKILTGNDLLTGAVVWWDGSGWSLHIADAADAGEAADSIIASESAARRVNSAYAIAAEQTADGPRPAHIKDRVRALGPTVRPDLAVKAAQKMGWDWVI
ncbi:DUF2849 domain-containing protein [Aurantiacibacter gangjinensis]|uniref:Uncharacterized protein n=1 Tax=Aurantiacibacter gangjinensis TaxID=502682 RepID=A0A0G9MVX6_9SPHN|nr:DUF2849 domain-containing protein [Aurantiacibacter gangjinensis]APE26985.1 hypothetical protein BMF35_a0156 [Aurantiacibacter gangjinensis]KLE33433.1 hypothetical protein AAW01_05780 [Aurantiacibacter gangjinensis]